MPANISSVEGVYLELSQAGPKAIERAKVALRKTALDIERNAKAIVPVDTGNLKNSIGHSDLRMLLAASMSVEVGPTAEYGQYVELGTSTQAPQAYMGPSLDRFEGPFAMAIEQLGLEALGG
jgi:HK97 gp10 family phage protein